MKGVMEILASTLIESSREELSEFARAKYKQEGRGAVLVNLAKLESGLIKYLPIEAAKQMLVNRFIRKGMERPGLSASGLLLKIQIYKPETSMVLVILPDAKLFRQFDFGRHLDPGGGERLPGIVRVYEFESFFTN